MIRKSTSKLTKSSTCLFYYPLKLRSKSKGFNLYLMLLPYLDVAYDFPFICIRNKISNLSIEIPQESIGTL